MKQIIKNREPHELTEQRAARGNYDNLHKDELRASLLKEQGWICCYCMCRIPQKLESQHRQKNYPDCKIEHVQCRSQHTDLELNYNNLLLACNGKHGSPRNVQTCDTYKGERDLSFNPADPTKNIEDFVKYNAIGEIFSDDTTIDRELNEVLNLNTKELRDNREIVYRNVQERIRQEGKKIKGRDIKRRFYEEEKEKLLLKREGKFEPFSMIGVYLINKKLSKLVN